MAATATPIVLDTPAAEFRLPATDGKTYALDDVAGEKGTVVVSHGRTGQSVRRTSSVTMPSASSSIAAGSTKAA
jgi:hypothetical protein